MVSSFKEFRSDVKTFLGFPWDTENVYFFQERDRYAASYKPKYPDNSGQDMVIQTLYGTDASNRGNYTFSGCWKTGERGMRSHGGI